MLKLELDWAAPDAPETGVVSERDDEVMVFVTHDETPGPSGWARVVVYVARVASYVPTYSETMALDAWVRDVYLGDDDDAEELVDLAVVV